MYFNTIIEISLHCLKFYVHHLLLVTDCGIHLQLTSRQLTVILVDDSRVSVTFGALGAVR